ncbi:MAG: TFIIB-type zinc ribbon-containing protein [Firmicutes bacterium]|nr:TFIIB-type zinc ribbon-containing protein [Bacillota bacterium]
MSTDKKTDDIKIVKTDDLAKDGQNKCPKCGATDISLNIKNGRLRCNYCRYEFDLEKLSGIESDISKLSGKVMASGAQNIAADVNDIVTFKCSSCGAEVIIDTEETLQARCHWCRHTLSVNQQIPNGSVPDMVLPFKISKNDAENEIKKFVGKRKFFANKKFKQEFTTENIMGVYFPYLVVDFNSQVSLIGQGEHLVRRYTRGTGEDQETYYDADLYNVERHFDLMIDNLTIESNKERLNNSSDKTNNIINSIMPFDIENCVKWNANFLKGFTSEKRNVNVDEIKPLVKIQAQDIARFAANDTLEYYDRGVAWENESLKIKGEQWLTAYLPVWLYSYQEEKGEKKLLHYVAVNARTNETMGSVPINKSKLFLMSLLVEILSGFAMYAIEFEYDWILLSLGFIYYFFMYNRYRNSEARHKHEIETKYHKENIQKVDTFVTKRTGLKNSKMYGANNKQITNESKTAKLLNEIIDNDEISKKIK